MLSTDSQASNTTKAQTVSANTICRPDVSFEGYDKTTRFEGYDTNTIYIIPTFTEVDKDDDDCETFEEPEFHISMYAVNPKAFHDDDTIHTLQKISRVPDELAKMKRCDDEERGDEDDLSVVDYQKTFLEELKGLIPEGSKIQVLAGNTPRYEMVGHRLQEVSLEELKSMNKHASKRRIMQEQGGGDEDGSENEEEEEGM